MIGKEAGMPYFQRNDRKETDYTRQFAAVDSPEDSPEWDEDGEEDDGELYDDGFDELTEEEPEEEIPEEELREERRRKYRIAAGIGDLSGSLIGVGVILALLAFLISMIRFVSTDLANNFSLLQSRF
jgi:hypothetical protein